MKKISLDAEGMKNYRPVSNLSFVPKVVKKVVAARLNNHMTEHLLAEPMQSPYQRNHSTESALLRVQNDILQAVDNSFYFLFLSVCLV